MQVTDRAKDVIKSGGEWISIDLENLAVGHPKVAEAAVIGVTHPKWDERPPCHRSEEGRDRTKDDILGFSRVRSPLWWLPDDGVRRGDPAHRHRQDQKTTLRKHSATTGCRPSKRRNKAKKRQPGTNRGAALFRHVRGGDNRPQWGRRTQLILPVSDCDISASVRAAV